MGFKRPGEGATQEMDGYRIADLEGCNIVISNVVLGESMTKYSDGEMKPHADCSVMPLDGPNKGETKQSRFYGGYLVNDLRGMGPEDFVLATVTKGSPRAGMREGWLILPIEDKVILKAAEKILGESIPF